MKTTINRSTRPTLHTVPRARYVPIRYTKNTPARSRELRDQFIRFDPGPPADMVGAQRDFLSHIRDNLDGGALRRAGLTDADIARLDAELTPKGWQVHHRFPLDDSGTNDFENLVLIRSTPDHTALTNLQRDLIDPLDLQPGQSVDVDFPMPPPGPIG